MRKYFRFRPDYSRFSEIVYVSIVKWDITGSTVAQVRLEKIVQAIITKADELIPNREQLV
jgi:hypothetical protein